MIPTHTKFNDDIFVVTHEGQDYAYAYRYNLLRKIEDEHRDALDTIPISALDEKSLWKLREIPRNPEWQLRDSLIIGVTSVCNLSCSYCHVSGGDYTATLSTGMIGSIKRLIAKAFAAKPKHFRVHFQGDGEALTKQKVMEDLMDYTAAVAGDIKTRFSLVTNATLINESNIEFIKRFTFIQVSFDGIPEINDMNRGLSDLTVAGMRLLVANKVNFAVRSTLSPEALDALIPFVDYMNQIVDPHSDHPFQLAVSPIHKGERILDDEDYVDAETFITKFLTAKEYAKTKNIILSCAYEEASMPQNSYCMATSGIFFAPSGTLSSCTRASREDSEHAHLIYGRFNPETLEYDIDQDKFANLKSLTDIPEDCKACPALMLCGGSSCYVSKNEYNCSIKIPFLLLHRLKAGGY